MTAESKAKILLIEPILPHYRKDVFRILSEYDRFDMYYMAGENYQGIKGISPANSIISKHRSFSLLGHRFYYLKESISNIKKIKPDVIICTGIDFHLIHTVLIFFRFRIFGKKRFYWWSHATAGKQGKTGYLLRKFVYKKSSGVMAYNQSGRKTLQEMGIGETRIAVVNNSINNEDYGFLNYDPDKKARKEAFTILYSGRVTKAKKVDLLIKALGIAKKKGLNEFKCYIIGEGEIERLRQLAEENNIKNEIVFTDARYGKENHEFFLQSDLFVYPGGIGLSIVHAMSFGLPVITTNNTADQFPEFELLVPGVNGDLFTDNSEMDLAGKIITWKSIMSKKGDQISKACIQRIKDMEYLPDKQAEKVIDFLMQTYENRERFY